MAFDTFVRLWVISEAAHNLHDLFLAPHIWWIYAQAPLFVAAFIFPSRLTAVLALVVRGAMYCVKAPYIWDSCVWAMFTDAAFVTAVLLYEKKDAVYACADLIRVQMGLFYFGAGFWKINEAFLDPRVSCASFFVASLLSFFPDDLIHRIPGGVGPLLAYSPHLTIAGEMVLGLCLLAPSRTAHGAGILLAGLLHYSIAITPFPNQVPTFGVICITRLFFVMPDAWVAACGEFLALPQTTSGLVLRICMGALVAGSVRFTSMPGFFLDWCLPVQTALCFLGARAVTIGSPPPKAKAPASKGIQHAVLWIAGFVLLLMTLSYVFLFQLLGILEVSAVAPFAVIRQHGGSNHLFMPTSLLQQWESTSHLDKFGGGIVRVTECTSDYMNAMYPSNCTDALPERVVALLREGGHIAQQFAPTVNLMLGPEIRAKIPHWQPSSGVPFPSYTVPALQLRRMVAEARATNEKFTLEYEHLPGRVGDETWRQTAVASWVRLEEDGKGGRQCLMRRDAKAAWTPCSQDELVLQPAPEGLLMKIMLFFPYPIIPGLDTLPCLD
ncbi:unnamed protein product [Symbiodinium sp. CCMP2456]|nr:unnamed protein product [Symbiodinium sp. CCMP2456]